MDVLYTSASRRKLRNLVMDKGLVREIGQMIISEHWKLSHFRKQSFIFLVLQGEWLKNR